MATATAKKPDAIELRKTTLAAELVGIHKKHAKDFGRVDELKTALKDIATENGSFQEIVTGKGKVKVSGEKPKEFLGNLPELVPAKFNELTPAKQKALVDSGLVAIVPNYSGAYYGRVTVDLF